jgi:hypothetical protein
MKMQIRALVQDYKRKVRELHLQVRSGTLGAAEVAELVATGVAYRNMIKDLEILHAKQRQAVQEAVEQVAQLHPYKVGGVGESYSAFNEGWSDACDLMETKVLQALLS